VKRPPIRYLVASPSGDATIDEGKLDYPLEGDPLKTSYREYFLAIADFLSGNDFQRLLQAITAMSGAHAELSNIGEIIVRSEKHGALSHPASIECILGAYSVKFGLHVAVIDAGKDSLQREFTTLKMLHSRFNLPYIPVPYVLHEMHSMVFLLEEWFDGYHEFHISRTGPDGQQLKLWEFGHGERFLTPAQVFEIYRQAAKILTIYYDLREYRLIYPWHHAAGDFVVKIDEDINPPAPPFKKGGDHFNLFVKDNVQEIPTLAKGDEGGFSEKIDVRLTTVRGYEPFIRFDETDMPHPALALFYFFLHLSIQMRLDKLDGVGERAWAADSCVDATVTGFFEGLEVKSDISECCGSIRSFLGLLQSFTKDEMIRTCVPIAEQFEKTKDYPLIQKHLRDHADRLYLTLRNFP